MTSSYSYVHGYQARESERLQDQADVLAELLHSDTRYPPGSRVLEAGCGIGSQTVTLASRSPDAQFTSIDISAHSLQRARHRVQSAGLCNVQFQQADLLALPFEPQSFDHVFVCFVLEHLPDPLLALRHLHELIRPGGSITVIEGDHGSTLMHPHSDAAHEAIGCLIRLQAQAGGNALIGRELHPLLAQAGFEAVTVSPRIAWADAGRPGWVDAFTRKTFIAMVEGVRDDAMTAGFITPERFDQGICDLHRTTQGDGTFCYSFFKACAHRAGDRSPPS
ncbi:class I SAM-dependent methyltransferase [Piscinibacter terrae]|uniref:Methyltransferase domain-containing protein n=1 Tax=Piscinibacter terrae TaxID=2496871 RepID=A0A3N7JYA2_9BURK|nr:class I SAM-dependent methyltransferase [Albitalea terrae]RQP25799.1 methyltransferase domain-containing protein [Albitalea terrae]